MDVSSVNQKLSPQTVASGGVDQSSARQLNRVPQVNAEEARHELSKVSDDIYQTKKTVGADLESIQKDFETTVSKLNGMLQGAGRNLTIGIDTALNGPVVTVKNTDTGEVVRQIPNETVVQLAHSIEAFKGWLHDTKV